MLPREGREGPPLPAPLGESCASASYSRNTGKRVLRHAPWKPGNEAALELGRTISDLGERRGTGFPASIVDSQPLVYLAGGMVTFTPGKKTVMGLPAFSSANAARTWVAISER